MHLRRVPRRRAEQASTTAARNASPGIGVKSVEIWFNRITQQAIHRGSFPSVPVLIERIQTFTEHYNPQATPFMWTGTADSILQKVERLCHAISGTRH
jgi:putative transposase